MTCCFVSQNWSGSDSEYHLLSPVVLWSALLYAVFHIVLPEYVANAVSSKIDERSAKLVSDASCACVICRVSVHITVIHKEFGILVTREMCLFSTYVLISVRA